MSASRHVESHFMAAATVRDVVIGMSDGLTVPFALAAGLSGAVGSTAMVVTAGFAEMAAGAISMGLGGYLAARTDAEHYEAERAREIEETSRIPDQEREKWRHLDGLRACLQMRLGLSWPPSAQIAIDGSTS